MPRYFRFSTIVAVSVIIAISISIACDSPASAAFLESKTTEIAATLNQYAARTESPSSFNEAWIYLHSTVLLRLKPDPVFMARMRKSLAIDGQGGLVIDEQTPPNIAETSYGLLISAKVKPLNKARQEQIAAWLAGRQARRGGFTEPFMEEPTLKTTALAIIAFDQLKRTDLVSQRTIEWIVAKRHRDGGFYEDNPSLESTYYAIKALDTSGQLERIKSEPVVKFILSCQNKDGGFSDIPEEEVSAMQATFQAVASLSLLNAGEEFKRESTIEFVKKLYRPGGFAPITFAPRADFLAIVQGVTTLILLGDTQTPSNGATESAAEEQEVGKQEKEKSVSSLSMFLALMTIIAGAWMIIKSTLTSKPFI